MTKYFGACFRAPAGTWRQRVGAMFVASVLGATAGCASNEAPDTVPATAPALTPPGEWIKQAQAATAQGDHEKARTDYRAAAQQYPGDKLPWLKLSEDYFNAHDYGHAVLAAQEALQRDPLDELAHSILAVSGLRITAGSLKALRPKEQYPVGSREEALAVTQSLRDALGEASLLPPSPAPAQTPAIRPERKPRATASGGPGTTTPPVPAAGTGNPLDKLK